MGEKFFLLTHDYLVPSIREWLTRKQRETRQGTGGTAAGGTLVALERQAREPASTVVAGMGEHRAADEEEGLDRSSTQDDEAGGAGAWAAGAGRGAVLVALVLVGLTSASSGRG